MEAAHQVLQEQLEGLGQAEHGLAMDHEGCDLLAAVVDDLALVGSRVVGADHGGRGVSEAPVHELVHAGGKVVPVSHGEEGRVVPAEHGGHANHGHCAGHKGGRGTLPDTAGTG